MSNIILLTILTILILFSIFVLYKNTLRKFWIRLLLVATIFLLSSLVFFSFESYKGWATNELPLSGYVHSVFMPNENEIYALMVPEEIEESFWNYIKYGYNDGSTPKLYKIPEEFHDLFKEGKTKLNSGFLVRFYMEEVYTTTNGVIGYVSTPSLQIINPMEMEGLIKDE